MCKNCSQLPMNRGNEHQLKKVKYKMIFSYSKWNADGVNKLTEI